MNAGIRLGPNYVEKMEVLRDTSFEELQKLFDITQKLMLDHQAEILNATPICGTAPSWARSALSHYQVITWTKARVRVYSDSVLCSGENLRSFSSESKMEKLKNFEIPIPREIYFGFVDNRLTSSGIFSQDLCHWSSSRRSRVTCKIEPLNLRILKIESSSCQCSVTSNGQRGNSEQCISNFDQVNNYAMRFSRGHWTFLGPGYDKKWYGTLSFSPEGKWDSTAAQMVERFKEPVIQFSRLSVL